MSGLVHNNIVAAIYQCTLYKKYHYCTSCPYIQRVTVTSRSPLACARPSLNTRQQLRIHSAEHTAEDGLDNGHSSEPGNQEAWSPNSEEQVSHWKAELASLSWRMLERFWCRFCPQFGFRSPGTVFTKTNAPCHFPRRWAIFLLQIKTSANKLCCFIAHPLHLSLLFLCNVTFCQSTLTHWLFRFPRFN